MRQSIPSGISSKEQVLNESRFGRRPENNPPSWSEGGGGVKCLGGVNQGSVRSDRTRREVFEQTRERNLSVEPGETSYECVVRLVRVS